MVTREQAILDEIRGLAQGALGLDAPPAPGAALVEDLGLDSMTLTSLAVALEDRFRVRLDDDEAARVRTLDELARLVARRTLRP